MTVAVEGGGERFGIAADWCPSGTSEIYVTVQFKTDTSGGVRAFGL